LQLVVIDYSDELAACAVSM